MAVTSMPVPSVALSRPLQAAAPRMLRVLIGGMLELMIHAVETLRDHRTGVVRG